MWGMNLYAKSLQEKRASILLAAGGLAPDIPIGNREIGYYDRMSKSWSEPTGLHWSDCAINNAPALPVGSCNCGGFVPEE